MRKSVTGLYNTSKRSLTLCQNSLENRFSLCIKLMKKKKLLSAMKIVKHRTSLSMINVRLTAVALMYIHKNIENDVQAAINVLTIIIIEASV